MQSKLNKLGHHWRLLLSKRRSPELMKSWSRCRLVDFVSLTSKFDFPILGLWSSHNDSYGITGSAVINGLIPEQKTNIIPGHEVVGHLVSIGANVDAQKWSIGSKVGLGWHHSSCSSCDACLRGEQWVTAFPLYSLLLPDSLQLKNLLRKSYFDG